MDVPEVVHINQSSKNSTINYIALRLRHEVERLGLEGKVKVGETVAISLGNVELTKMVGLISPLVGKLRQMGLHPYIFISEAMAGSSNMESAPDSTNNEALEVLLGCPIYRATATNSIRNNSDGLPLYLEELVFISDHIIVINKITSDTSFKNFVLSGMQDRRLPEESETSRIHASRDKQEESLYRDLHEQVFNEIIRRWPIMFCVGMIEDKDGHAGQVRFISSVDLFNDKRLRVDMKKNLDSELSIGKIDLLVIDKLGATTNEKVVHSMRNFAEDANIRRIYIRDLCDGAKGNSSGVGYADFVSTKVVQKTNRLKTYDDCIAASDPRRGATPIYYDTDAEVLGACLKTLGNMPFRDIKMVYIKDATSLSEMVVSRALFRDKDNYEWLPPLDDWKVFEFDEIGNIISPFRGSEEKNSIMVGMKSFFSTGFRYGF